MATIIGWFWSFLPDRCMCLGCARDGVRGNENRIGDVIVCDGCHAEMLQGRRAWPRSKKAS